MPENKKNNDCGGGGPDKDPDKDPKKNNSSEVSGYFINALKHIFRQAEGHLLDTPKNRKLIFNMATKAKNYLGTDIHGNRWYGEILNNGKQIWAWTRDKLIRDAGINEIPRTFNAISGLCSNFVNKN